MPKNNFGLSLRKIFISLIIFLFFVIIMGIGLLFYSIYNTQKTDWSNLSSATEIQLANMGNTLSSINMYMLETVLNNSLIDTINTSESIHERNVAARSLWNELDRHSNYWNENFSFFYYSEMHGLSISHFSSASNYIDSTAISEQIKNGTLGAAMNKESLSWMPIIINDKLYLIQLYTQNNGSMACWIACDDLFTFLEEVILSNHGYFTLLNEEKDSILGEDISRFLSEDKQPHTQYGVSSGLFKVPTTTTFLLISSPVFANQGIFMLLLGSLIVTLFLIVALSVYVLYYYRKYIEQPFHQFQKYITDYKSSRDSIKQSGFAELNEAVATFDSFEKQINELKIDMYEEKLVLAKTELEYFQLQIKPHFFVNCFSLIFSMAQKKNYERIQYFCLKLSNYVRYLFQNSMSTVSLKSELDIVHEYLDIQDIRYHYKIQMNDQVASGLSECKIPTLLLITFVENAIKHSFPTTDNNLTVFITVSEKNEQLCIVVENTGTPFSSENLIQLNNSTDIQSFSSSGDGIGISNIYKRLSLLYGNRYSLHFSNSQIGAKVTVLIPKE